MECPKTITLKKLKHRKCFKAEISCYSKSGADTYLTIHEKDNKSDGYYWSTDAYIDMEPPFSLTLKFIKATTGDSKSPIGVYKFEEITGPEVDVGAYLGTGEERKEVSGCRVTGDNTFECD